MLKCTVRKRFMKGSALKLSSEERKAKGRANRERIHGVKPKLPHVATGEKISQLPRMPQTRREMRMHLSGRHTDKFREPISRKERRQWERFWKLKGRGFTQSPKGGRQKVGKFD